MRHQNMRHQSMLGSGAKKGGRSPIGFGNRANTKHQSMLGGSRRYGGGMFGTPKNDGNIYTSGSKMRNRDFFGNHTGARRPSAMTGCVVAALPLMGVALTTLGLACTALHERRG
jgi:hypothetical protein